MEERMTVMEVSKRLHLGQTAVREMIKQNRLPFAVAIDNGNHHYNYMIFRTRFEAYLKGEDLRREAV